MPQLKILLDDTGGVIHDLTDSRITVGRISENSLQIEDPSVSSRHATLTLDSKGDYVLRDVGSTNGTIINGKALNPDIDHKLKNGDKITFGKVDTSYISEPPAEIRPLPEVEKATAVVAATSARPVDFSNASPFPTKRNKRDTVGIVLFVLATVAIAAWGYVILLVYTMRPPAF